jgi:hypothetical protein
MLLSGWMALLLVESFCNDNLSLVLVGGSIGVSIPLALVLAWALGSSAFHAVVVYCFFVLAVIALDLVELCLR